MYTQPAWTDRGSYVRSYDVRRIHSVFSAYIRKYTIYRTFHSGHFTLHGELQSQNHTSHRSQQSTLWTRQPASQPDVKARQTTIPPSHQYSSHTRNLRAAVTNNNSQIEKRLAFENTVGKIFLRALDDRRSCKAILCYTNGAVYRCARLVADLQLVRC